MLSVCFWKTIIKEPKRYRTRFHFEPYPLRSISGERFPYASNLGWWEGKCTGMSDLVTITQKYINLYIINLSLSLLLSYLCHLFQADYHFRFVSYLGFISLFCVKTYN